MPIPDLPFDEEFLDYARKCLSLAGLEPDRQWLKVRPLKVDVLDILSEQGRYYVEARKAVPRSRALWEQEAFIRPAFRAAIWDLQFGAIKQYREFEFLYMHLLGIEARDYLPMVFSAAARSPTIEADFGRTLTASLSDILD